MIIHSTTLDTEAKVKAIYGGTSWSKIEGMFLLGQSSSYAINSTGGEATHTLTTNEMPSHSHTYSAFNWDTSGTYEKTAGSGSHVHHSYYTSQSAGGGQAHNNMPPYKVVYIWERTA